MPVALRLGRVSNLPTVWTNVAAGVALAGAVPGPRVMAALVVSASLFYVAGMYLNDAFDRRVDAIERPERPIPSGDVRATTVFACGFAMLAAALVTLAVAAAVGPVGRVARPMASGAVLAATIVVYDVIHKRTRAGVVVMATCRSLVYVTSALCVSTTAGGALVAGAAALFVYIVGLTAVAVRENLKTLGSSWPLGLLAASAAAALWLARDEPTGAALAILFAGWTFETVRGLMRGRVGIPATVGRLIAGVSLLDAALIGGQGYAALAVAAALATVLTSVLQRSIPGT